MTIPIVSDRDFTLYVGDALDVLGTLPDGCVDAVVTSPPYLDARPEYDAPTFADYRLIFKELARVCSGGMLWNVGRLWKDGIEQLWWVELILAAANAGWEIWDTGVWVKPNANPIRGRVLADSHEYVLVFGRDAVSFNGDAIRTEYAPSSLPRLRRRWRNGTATKGNDRAPQESRRVNELGARPRSFFVSYVGREKGNQHPAPMALDLAEDIVELACWPGQTILDPFHGSGTTSVAARARGRRSIGIEKRADYAAIAAERLSQQSLLGDVA